MRIFVRDLMGIDGKTGPRVRFSVTYAHDNGEPVATERGWTMGIERAVVPPSSRTGFGRYYKIVEPSEWLVEKLVAVLSDLPEVEKLLGPRVEGINVSSSGREVLDVNLEVL